MDSKFPFKMSVSFGGNSTFKKFILWCCLYLFGYARFDLRWLILSAGAWYLIKIFRHSKKVQHEAQVTEAHTVGGSILKKKDPELPSWVVHPDMQRVEWANRVIQQLWPHVELYLVQVLKAVEEDTQLKERLAGYHIKYLKFPVVHLGKIPPRINGVKVHNSVHRDEIIMDVGVQYNGDLCIQMEVSLDSLPAYIPPATSSIRNLSLTSSSFRIHLRPLLTDVPFIGAVTVSFLQPPEIDFDLGGIANALDIPGISMLLRHVIQDQLEQTIVMPNSMTIELVPENDRKKRPSKFGDAKTSSSSPVVVSIPTGVLNVEIIEGKGLVNKDSALLGQGKSDPYATLEMRADGEIHNFKTEVIQNNLHPVWKMLIDLPVDNPETLEDLLVCVFDEDKYGKDESLGKCTVPVQVLRTAITSGQTQDVWKMLEGVKRGSLHVQVGWSELKLSCPPDSSMCHKAVVVVIVDSCSSLLGGRTGLKLPNPRVKVEVCGVVQFTDTVIGSVDPVFSHRMSFLVADPISDSLLVTVEDDRREKLILGTLRLDLSDVLDRTSLSMVNHRFALTSRVLRGKQSPDIILTVALRYIHRPKTHSFGVHKSLQELQKIMTSTVSNLTQEQITNPQNIVKNETVDVPDHKGLATNNGEIMVQHEKPFMPENQEKPLMNGFNEENKTKPLTNGNVSPQSTKRKNSESDLNLDPIPIESDTTNNRVPKSSTLPIALSQYQKQTAEAQEFIRANSVSGQKARERLDDKRPKIQLSLKYNTNNKMLSVVVHKIRNLDETPHTSIPSAYVKTRILERGERPGSNRRIQHTKRKTKTQRHTASPVFEETLEYCLHESDLRHRRLEVSVWHDSRLSVLGLNTVLGRCLVSLDDVANAISEKKVEGTTLTDWHILSPDGEDHEFKPNLIRSPSNSHRSTLPKKLTRKKKTFGSKGSLFDIEIKEVNKNK